MSETETPIAETETPAPQPAAAKPKKTKAPAEGETVSYKSAQHEITEYEIMGFRGQRGADNALHWQVPAELAERFERHIFVVQGRVVKVS